MPVSKTLGRGQRGFRKQPQRIFVDRDQFCELLISYRKLTRSDDPTIRAQGLLDVERGRWYLITRAELFDLRD
jgi:hypothetical protein